MASRCSRRSWPSGAVFSRGVRAAHPEQRAVVLVPRRIDAESAACTLRRSSRPALALPVCQPSGTPPAGRFGGTRTLQPLDAGERERCQPAGARAAGAGAHDERNGLASADSSAKSDADTAGGGVAARARGKYRLMRASPAGAAPAGEALRNSKMAFARPLCSLAAFDSASSSRTLSATDRTPCLCCSWFCHEFQLRDILPASLQKLTTCAVR